MLKPRNVSFSVVSVCRPGEWVVRAMGTYTSGRSLIMSLLPIVGTLDPELVWYGYTYEGLPFYAMWRLEGHRRISFPYGIYYFPIEKTYDRDYGTYGPHLGDMLLGEGKRIGEV